MRFVRAWLPVILWSALILSAANDSFSANESGGWLTRLFGLEVPWLLHVILRKLAHVLAYGILGWLAWRAQRTAIVAVLVVAAVASTDEWLQSATRARTGTAWDVILDLCAAVLVIVFLVRRARLSSPRSAD